MFLKQQLSARRMMLSSACLFLASFTYADEPIDFEKTAVLPGEYTAEQILNGEYQWPPSPEVDMTRVENAHFDPQAFGVAPAPGVHPRILFSPEDIPAIRKRITETELGKLAHKNLKKRQQLAFKKGTAFSNVYEVLLKGDLEAAEKRLKSYKEAGTSDGTAWHHRPQFVYILMLESFDSLIFEDKARQEELAIVATNLGKVYQKRLDRMDNAFLDQMTTKAEKGIAKDGNAMEANEELNSDAWRSGRRGAIDGDPYFAFIYDFLHGAMTEEQQKVCRNTLNTYTYGKTVMGSHMPHHFRRWNWIAVGSGMVLSVLATEGEEGHDGRVFRHTSEILEDYVKYGFSEKGSSREAIGYTQFGFIWGYPALAAMARRGHNLWDLDRWYQQNNWYAHSKQPGQPRFISRGDGGHGAPEVLGSLFFKKAYPGDPNIDYVFQHALEAANQGGDKIDGGSGYIFYQLLFADDPSDKKYDVAKDLGLEKTFYDPERQSLITRTDFSENEVQFQMESRPDGVAANHQHSDRGHFTLAGVGQTWAIDRFRAVESRHHNTVIIDGKGQGYFPPNGKLISMLDKDAATFMSVDSKKAYDFAWPGHLGGFTDLKDPRRKFKRWLNFTEQADDFLKENPGYNWKEHLDKDPYIEAYYSGYESGDPRMWDEYSRPVLFPHNKVEKAFRSGGLVRGKYPYALIVDDIKKDDVMRNYDWLMQVDAAVNVHQVKLDEIILSPSCDLSKSSEGIYRSSLKKGEPALFVKVLHRAIPKDSFHNPQIRLETFEMKDARLWPNGRSFGLAKRLVIPSYSKEPKFTVLLFPYKVGEETPKFEWNESHTEVTVAWKDQVDTLSFTDHKDGYRECAISRDEQVLIQFPGKE